MTGKTARLSIRKYKSVAHGTAAVFVLNVQCDGRDPYALKVWYKEPTNQDMKDVISIFRRSCMFYHQNLRIPNFEMPCVREWEEHVD